MRKYTEEDLRTLASLIDEAYRPYTSNNVEGSDVVENFIRGIIPKEEPEEDLISFTYSFLRRKLDWMEFCDLTGVNFYSRNEGYEIKDNEVFEITESDAIKFGLL